MENLKINTKVNLNVEAINNSEFKFQFENFKAKKSVIVTDVFDHANQTFEFKLSPKSKKYGILPVNFII